MSRIMVFEESIIYVHDDYDPWASLFVGLDDKRQLIVEMSYESLGGGYDPRYGYKKRIVVNPAGTDVLIDKLNTTLTKLPRTFRDEFGNGHDEWEAKVSEVFDTFNEIRNYLEALNVRYEVEREERDF